jgi:hypothetical protein
VAILAGSKGEFPVVKVIPDQPVPFRGAGAQAERKTLEYLRALSDDYYVLRECKLTPSAGKRRAGSQEDRSDFILIGPALGVLVLEVKDWNIRANDFRLLNQYQVLKTDIHTHVETILDNPWHQAAEYNYALRELLAQRRGAPSDKVWISAFVVYPKVTRAEFENAFAGRNAANPQNRYVYDPDATLFQEDLHPVTRSLQAHLVHLVNKQCKNQFSGVGMHYKTEQIEAVVDWLIPSEMRVGGLPQQEGAVQKLAILDRVQQEWAFSDALDQKHYLADVAGSGKTNVLLSRAIYWAKKHQETGGCRILVTTYSKALQGELRRIFKEKIAHDPLYSYYTESIFISDVTSLMENIVRRDLSKAFSDWKTHTLRENAESDYIEYLLPEKCIDILKAGKVKFEPYDYLLIDEIQDFSGWFFDVMITLLKDRNNFFAVGDVGQKLFERELEWSDHDIVIQRASLESRFLMYRSPQPIAKLAWKFLIADPFMLNTLKEDGYKTEIKPRSPLLVKPVFRACSNQEELLAEMAAHLQEYVQLGLADRILCIGSKSGLLPRLHAQLQQLSLPVRWATEMSGDNGKYLLFADFVEAKGLERDYVFIVDVEHLATQPDIFASAVERRKGLMRDRIKLFVALTRAMREVRLYSIDQYHPFMRDLHHLQEKA